MHNDNVLHNKVNRNKMEENVDREVTLEDYKNSKKSEEQKDGNDEVSRVILNSYPLLP